MEQTLVYKTDNTSKVFIQNGKQIPLKLTAFQIFD